MRTLPSIAFLILALLTVGGSTSLGGSDRPARSVAPAGVAPERLSETGLFADLAPGAVAADVLPYSPQYPLWSDGAEKRRWIQLPAGSVIDASNPDVWSFPVGTKLWKEFGFEGHPVETRYMERRPDGGWLFATYVWKADGSEAWLAPDRGLLAGPMTPSGRPWEVPGYYDCLACHEGRPNRVLGFNALQLSSDRDPQALHASAPEEGAIDLDGLVARGLLTAAPDSWTTKAPKIPGTPETRAAVGYLYGNCAGCHNADGPLASLGLSFDIGHEVREVYELPVLQTARDRAARGGRNGELRLASGDPEHSWALQRLSSAVPSEQMPPLGVHVTDHRAVELITTWIDSLEPAASRSAAEEAECCVLVPPGPEGDPAPPSR